MKTREKIKKKALAQLMLDVKFGFDNEEEIFDNISFTFYGDEDYEEEMVEIQLMELISKYYQRHQIDSLGWEFPTDFDKLANVFDELTKKGIICLHNVYNRQDGIDDCLFAIKVLTQKKIQVLGFCYYNSDDLQAAITSRRKSLILEFGSLRRGQEELDIIKKEIIRCIESNGLQINIKYPDSKKIEIKNMDWKKKPDKEDWWVDRVINLLTHT